MFTVFALCVLINKTSCQQVYEYDAGKQYFNTKNYFYDNGVEVIAFDAQLSPELASNSIKFLRTKTSNPITWVVILHPGIDRFNGLSEFKKEGARSIASIKTVDALESVYNFKTEFFLDGGGRSFGFTKDDWPPSPSIDSTFENSFVLKLKNGQTIVLRDLSKAGPNANHTIAYIAEEEIIFVGNLLQPQVHAYMDGVVIDSKQIPKLAGWIDNLNELKRIFKNDSDIIIYGGRGKSVSLPTAIWDQTRYLKNAYSIIVNFYNSNRNSWEGSNVPPRYYKELQIEMESAFPGYEHSYLTRTALWNCWNCPGAEKVK